MSLRATLSSAAAISLLIGFLSVAIANEPEIDVIFPGVPIEGEQLGWELSADGSLLAVAAPPWIEAVYVFAKDGSGWAQEARLTPPIGTAPSSRFGTAIAISADTLVIGAPGDDPNASPNSLGAAFVYKRSNGTWSLTNKLVPAGPLPDFVTGVTFGASVAIDGDNLLVGAPGVDFDRTFVNVGAVYPYRFDGNRWVEQPRIDLPDFTGSNSGFGTSIALDGSTAVVTNVGLTGFSRRVALVYEFDGTSWIRTDVLQASDAADRWDLRGAADISANRMILRGFRNPTGERSTAAAYLFGKNSSGWEELQKLEADGTEVITASGTPHVDVDDVVILDAVIVISGRISVSNVVGGSTYDGGAFVFETDDGLSWNQTRFLRSTNVITVGPSSGFGSSVAITESDILVGAPGDDTQIADGGAVYVFSGPPPITDEISITPTQLDFGAVVLGQSAQQSLAVQNLSNSSITVSVSLAPPFSVAPSGEIPIGAGETALVNVHFAPTSTGFATGTLTFSTIQRSIDVLLSGEGVAPAQPVVDVSTNVLSFPDTVIGTLSQPIEIIVTNVGDAELTVAAVDIFGNSEDFAIGTVDCTRANVPPGASCTLSFAFSPAGSGTRSAQAAVVSNAANAPTLISLEGNGLEPVPIATVQPTGFDFEGTYLNETSMPFAFSVSNVGGADLFLGAASLSGANSDQFTVSGDTCSDTTLTANATCFIEISFSPSVSGALSALLSIPTNDFQGQVIADVSGIALEPPSGPEQVRLTVEFIGTGSGSVTSKDLSINCDGTCTTVLDQSTRVSLSAMPDPGSTFVGWSQSACSADKPCALRLNGSDKISATFIENLSSASKKIIYVGVCGAVELLDNSCHKGFGWYDPRHRAELSPFNPMSDGDLEIVGLTYSGLDAIGLRIGALYPSSVTFVTSFSVGSVFGDLNPFFIRKNAPSIVAFVESQYAAGDAVYLVGHSAGGGIIQEVAHKLKNRKIPVALTAQIDSVGLDSKVSTNVSRALNFYYTKSIFQDACLILGEDEVVAGKKSDTVVSNVEITDPIGPYDLGSLCGGHKNIDNDPYVWWSILGEVLPPM